MDYFLLDEHSGELRTAKPLDREALPDGAGIMKLTVRVSIRQDFNFNKNLIKNFCLPFQAREVVNGVPSNDPMESSTATVTITIRDVNDSPPTFNNKEYEVSLPENTATGTPLALDMNVTDHDVGINSKFSLRLEDVSEVFEVEPKLVTGFSQVHIRVANGSLDYENPNQRKFIVLVIAEETDTNPKLSSTATITVSVLDVNDNKPMFEQESYSASVSESALPGQYITTITAKDMDSGNFGDAGLRYSLSGNGAELFHVNEKTGVVTLADCSKFNESSVETARHKRQYEDMTSYLMSSRNSDENNDADYEYRLLKTADAIDVNNELMPETSSLPKTCLDFETENTYFLSYKATDDEGRGTNSVVSLRISVTDANDSPPVCESPYYRASVDEGSRVFEAPLIVKARDADTVSDITYRYITTFFM